MSPARPARPLLRPKVLAPAVVVLVLVALGGWLVLGGGDDDGLDDLRALPAVTSAEREVGPAVDVRLRPGTDARAISEVIDRIPDEIRRGSLRLGRATLAMSRITDADDGVPEALVAAAGVRTPGGPIEFRVGYGSNRLVATARRRADAAPLARELLAGITPAGGVPRGVEAVEVDPLGGASSDDSLVTLGDLAGSDARTTTAVLDAVARLDPALEARVVGNRGGTEIRVRAEGVPDAGAAWRSAADAVSRSARGDVEVFVDVPATADPGERADDDDTRALLSGRADTSPDRALALLEGLRGPTTESYVTTDLKSAVATVRGPSGAREAAVLARDAGARRLYVEWRADGVASDGWLTDVVPVEAEQNAVGDAPATVLRVLQAAARARAAGFAALQWDTRAVDGVPRLALSRPRRIDAEPPLLERSTEFRRLVRSIRSIDWPGTAGLDLRVAPSSCSSSGSGDRPTEISVVSSASGRARSVKARSSCADDDAVRTLRRAWNATAD